MGISPVMSQHRTTVSASHNPRLSAEGDGGASDGNSADDLMNTFMQLLVAQMQNQDPTNPMDNNQLTSQLAQFNTAAGVQELNSTLNSVGTLVTSMQQMNAAEWVGRKVLVEGDSTVQTNFGGNQDFGMSLDTDADDVTVSLTDPAGKAYTAHLKDVKAGVHQYTMDDLKDFEPSAPPADGSYKVSFSATNNDGSTPNIVSLKKATVDGVSFTQTGAVLQLGVDGTATLSGVYLIE
ncbi:Basal-body rod modification protein FlgD [Enterobacter sp. DC4]|uniref:flagellar hook assembly protein FlgD n=1 Tax=Enterobacter sp. DC4 TaxID=1395580 RepID=UPI0003ECDE46|nr:flagellar hook capping FlgD N-terminal domain-containing protein [Enterobacter sp. DC4]EWG67284.1 Basal-body rod modification protein FlgD [Enterobacter sp. DC4]